MLLDFNISRVAPRGRFYRYRSIIIVFLLDAKAKLSLVHRDIIAGSHFCIFCRQLEPLSMLSERDLSVPRGRYDSH